MRPIPLMTALAASLLMAGAAAAASPPPAQPSAAAAAAADAPLDVNLPPMAEDRAQADAMTAQLEALDARIGADEQRMTVLRNGDLAQQNARIRAIRPALPFGAQGRPHHWL